MRCQYTQYNQQYDKLEERAANTENNKGSVFVVLNIVLLHKLDNLFFL